jgi:hypothetical protein
MSRESEILKEKKKVLDSFKELTKEEQEDEDFMIQFLKHSPLGIEFCSEKIKKIENVLLATKYSLEHADDSLKRNKELIIQLFENGYDPVNFQFLSKEFQKDKQILKLIATIFFPLKKKKHEKKISHKFPSSLFDSELMDSLIELEPRMLKFSSSLWLESDLRIMMKAFKRNPDCIQYAPYKILSDKKFMEKILRKHGHSLNYASKDIQDDEKLVLIAIQNNPTSFQFASIRVRSIESVALTACKLNRFCIQYVSNYVKFEHSFVLEISQWLPIDISLSSYLDYLRYSSDRYLFLKLMNIPNRSRDVIDLSHGMFNNDKDNDIIIGSVLSDPRVLGYLGWKSKEFFIEICSLGASPFVMMYADKSFFLDQQFVESILSLDGLYLCQFPYSFSDKSLVLKTLKQFGNDSTKSRRIFSSLSFGALKDDKDIEWKCLHCFKLIIEMKTEDLKFFFH